MSEANKIEQAGKKIMVSGMALYAVLLPFQPLFPPITFAIALFWLGYLMSFKKQRFPRLFKNVWFWVFAVLYFMQIVGLTYSEHSKEGQLDVLLKITLFLWPAAFASLNTIEPKVRKIVVSSFVGATILSCLFNLWIGVKDVIQTGEVGLMMHSHLAHWPMIPNHYLGLYVSVSIVFGLSFLVKRWHDLTNWWRWGGVISVLFLMFFLVLLSVRIQMIALPLALLLLTVIHFKKNITIKMASVIVAAFIGFTILLWIIPSSHRRITDTFDEIRSLNGMVNKKQTNHRVFIWKHGLEVIKEKVWLGAGTGAADYALHEKLLLSEAKFWNGKNNYYLHEKLYNFHNSFLQHWAANGVIAFILFTLIIAVGFVKSLKNNDVFAFTFILLFTISILTESMLERQAGVVFFGFFYSLFFINKGQLQERSKEE